MAWFDGLKVLSLETRRREEMLTLIEKYEGVPTVVPSLREVALDTNTELMRFVERLEAGNVDYLVCMTGVGTRMFLRDVVKCYPEALKALKNVNIVIRGNKPLKALKEFGLSGIMVKKPHTWREVQDFLLSISLQDAFVSILEFGEPTPLVLMDSLKEQGATVQSIPVYRCVLPEDPTPLQEAVKGCIRGEFDVLLLSSGTQIVHFLKCARDMGLDFDLRQSLKRMVICSIGPACSEAIGDLDLSMDVEASPHKMGILVRQASENAGGILQQKRPVTSWF